MTPLKTKNLKPFLAGLMVMVLLWGCAHGRGGESAPETVPVEASPLEASPLDAPSLEAAPPPFPSDDADPFFEDEPDDDFFDDNQDAQALKAKKLVFDPLSPFNRAMFVFNDKLYFWCLKPVARGYKAVTPLFFRKGVKHAFHNIGMPARFVSSILQGKIKGAGTELSRFVVNTTVGLAGVWDPAEKYLGLKPYDEDLGQTLGVYGIGNGLYIVWPVLGPSTIRDTVGMAGDMFLNPLYYVEPDELAYGLGALELVNATAFRLGDYEAVKAASLDPYVMIRDFYIDYRQKKIAD